MKPLYAISIVYSITLTFFYAIGQLSLEFLTFISNIIFPITAGFAVVSCLLTLGRYGWMSKSEFPTILFFASIGIFMWFLADLTVAICAVYFQIEAFPSLGDIFYLGGYPWLFLALYRLFGMFQPAFSKKMFQTVSISAVILAYVVSQVLLIPVIASGTDPVNLVLSVAYPSLDLILFALSFSILLIFIQGGIGKAWFFFTLSILLATIADLLFSYLQLQELFYKGHPVELLWLLSYVIFLVGLHKHRKEF